MFMNYIHILITMVSLLLLLLLLMTSDNEYGGSISCVKVSKWGSEWGLRNRSRVMFVAFWVSFLGMLIFYIFYCF